MSGLPAKIIVQLPQRYARFTGTSSGPMSNPYGVKPGNIDLSHVWKSIILFPFATSPYISSKLLCSGACLVLSSAWDHMILCNSNSRETGFCSPLTQPLSESRTMGIYSDLVYINLRHLVYGNF